MMRTRNWRAAPRALRSSVIGLGVAIGAIAGCGPSEQTRFNPSPPAAEVASGWRVHVGDDFHFYAPAHWMIPADMTGMPAFPAANVEVKPVDPKSVGDTVCVFIVDTDARTTIGDARTQLIVRHEKRRTNLSLEVERMRKTVPEISEESDVEFPVGPGHEFVTMFKTISGEQIHEIHIVLVNESDVYTFKFVETGGNTRLMQVARPIVHTFRLGKPAADALPAQIENPFGEALSIFGK
jgi:hypothetical protein